MNKRSTNRLKSIRALPCVVCGKPNSQAAHSNSSKHSKGMGTKASDEFTIPLCHNHHAEFDQFQKMNRSQSEEWFDQMLEKTNRLLALDEKEVF